MERNILYAFAKAIIENDREILYEAFINIVRHRTAAESELKAKENGVNLRTGKPYKPSTIKACQSRLEHYERLQEGCDFVFSLFNESMKKGKIPKRPKSKGKVVQLTKYQERG
jgi:hypothetical protein